MDNTLQLIVTLILLAVFVFSIWIMKYNRLASWLIGAVTLAILFGLDMYPRFQ